MVVLAVDMGGSKIKVALVTSSMDVLYVLEVPTNASKGREFVVDALIDACRVVLSQAKRKVSAIGVSLTGVVVDNNLGFNAGVLKFLSGYPLHALLEKTFSLPVVFANDADCFALAESSFGAGQGSKKVLGVIWGSGLGSGVVMNNDSTAFLLANSELGALPVIDPESGKQVLSGDLCAGLAVQHKYFLKTGKKKSMKEIYASSDRVAKSLVKTMVSALAKTLASAIVMISPDVIILGGGVSQLPVLQVLKKEVKTFLPKGYPNNYVIKRFGISDDAGLFGAAILALQQK